MGDWLSFITESRSARSLDYFIPKEFVHETARMGLVQAQFVVEIDNIDQNEKVKGLKVALGKIINLTTTFSSETDVVGPPSGLISDSQRLLDEINSGRLDLTQSEAIMLMKSGLFKFEN